MKNKSDYIEQLVLIAFKIDEKANIMHERTKRLQKMATMARQGLKETHEFKILEQEFSQPRVTDFGNEINDLQKVVKQLKRYKWNGFNTIL